MSSGSSGATSVCLWYITSSCWFTLAVLTLHLNGSTDTWGTVSELTVRGDQDGLERTWKNDRGPTSAPAPWELWPEEEGSINRAGGSQASQTPGLGRPGGFQETLARACRHGASHPDRPQAGQTGGLGSPGSSCELGTTGKGPIRYQEPGNQGWHKNRGDAALDSPTPAPCLSCLNAWLRTGTPASVAHAPPGPTVRVLLWRDSPRAQDLELFLRQPVLGGSQASQVGWGCEVCPGPSTWRGLAVPMGFSISESRLGGVWVLWGLRGKEEERGSKYPGGQRREKPTSGVHKAVTTQ